jgi:hypothetical protein
MHVAAAMKALSEQWFETLAQARLTLAPCDVQHQPESK